MSTAANSDDSKARLSPWSELWDQEITGWHLQDVNEFLIKYLDKVVVVADDGAGETAVSTSTTTSPSSLRWLVTLCGKTVDMAYLAQLQTTERVIGIDGVRKPLQEFAQEYPALQIQNNTDASIFSGKKIDLIHGDFLEQLQQEQQHSVDIVWDRASLMAIDPSLQQDYVKVIRQWLKPGGKILLNVVDRRSGTPESMAAGPPYSISETLVHQLYSSGGSDGNDDDDDWIESIEKLEEYDEFQVKPEIKQYYTEGLESLYEVVYLIQTKK